MPWGNAPSLGPWMPWKRGRKPKLVKIKLLQWPRSLSCNLQNSLYGIEFGHRRKCLEIIDACGLCETFSPQYDPYESSSFGCRKMVIKTRSFISQARPDQARDEWFPVGKEIHSWETKAIAASRRQLWPELDPLATPYVSICYEITYIDACWMTERWLNA